MKRSTPAVVATLIHTTTLMVLVVTATWAASGQTGGILLQQPFGARPYALGNAYSAIGDDIFGMSYNPAIIARLKESQAATEFTQSVVDTKLGYAALASPISPRQALGLGIAYLDGGNIDLFNDFGQKTNTVNFERDFLINLNYARTVTLAQKHDLYLGLSPKLLRTTIGSEVQSTGLAMDFGALYEQMWGMGKLSAGLVVANLGPRLRYSGGLASGGSSFALPLTTRFSFGYNREILKSDSIAIGLQIDRIFHDDVLTQNLGIEYNYHRLCALRLGYQKRPEGSDIRLGLGLNVKDFSLDYGMGLIQTFNNIQHFSVTYRFTVPGIQYGATAPLEKIARSIKAAVTNKRYLDAVTDIQRLRGVVTDSQEAIRFSHQIQTEMQEIVQSGPSSYRYNYALALNSYEQGRWDEVVEYLQTYQRSDPLNEEVKRFLATARTKIDDQNKQLLIQQQARTGVLFEIANQAYDAGDISRAQRIIDEILRVGPYQPAESLRRKIKSYQEVAPKALIVQPAAKVVSPSPVQVEKTANDPVQAEALYYEALRDYANNDLNAAVSKLTLSCKLDPTKESYRNPLERIKKELEQRKSPGLKK